MTLHDCQLIAQCEGFDRTEFIGKFQNGCMQCMWLDAYLGLLLVEDDKHNGRVASVQDIEHAFPRLEIDNIYVLDPIELEDLYPDIDAVAIDAATSYAAQMFELDAR